MNGRFTIPGAKSGALHAAVLLLMVVGALVAYGVRDQPDQVRAPEIEHRRECAPVVWHAGMDQRGWQMLLEEGYTSRPDDGEEALYPPGCESA